MTFTQTVARDLAADAVLTLLAETWPTCFVVYEKRRSRFRGRSAQRLD